MAPPTKKDSASATSTRKSSGESSSDSTVKTPARKASGDLSRCTSQCKDNCRKAKTAKDGLHVHPLDELDKPVKISCPSCIAGHRSGSCQHYDRILLKIRPAGRPSAACPHPSVCGAQCMQTQAFVIRGKHPEWCEEHTACVLNWEFSDVTPEYPLPQAQKRRMKALEAAATPATNDAEEESKSSQMPASQSEARTSSCCSSGSKRTQSSISDTTFPPTPIPVMRTGSSIPEQMPSFIPQVPVFSNVAMSHTASAPQAIPDFVTGQQAFSAQSFSTFSNFDFGATNQVPDMSFFGSGYEPAPTIQQDQHNVRDRSPPRKRPCPGSGFQCPCDPNNCICERCYTHNQGLDWSIPGFKPADFDFPSHEQLPPQELTPEPPSTNQQHEQWRETQALPTFDHDFSGYGTQDPLSTFSLAGDVDWNGGLATTTPLDDFPFLPPD